MLEMQIDLTLWRREVKWQMSEILLYFMTAQKTQ